MLRLFRDEEEIAIPNLTGTFLFSVYSDVYKQQWIELLNSNNDFGYWDGARFSNEMLGNLAPGTEILAVDHDGLVGSSAAFSMREYLPYAVLAYPIVLTSYRGQGLGSYLIARTLASCQLAGYPGIILHTDDFRIPAIRSYLRLGFVPDTQTYPHTRERWNTVLGNLQSS
jgi:mycothiol synthase